MINQFSEFECDSYFSFFLLIDKVYFDCYE